MIRVQKWPPSPRYLSKRLRRAAKDQSCVLCGNDEEGRVILAHLPSQSYGMTAGCAQKTHDWLGAHLCDRCHAYVDGPGRKDTDLRMMALCRTLERLFDSGELHSVG